MANKFLTKEYQKLKLPVAEIESMSANRNLVFYAVCKTESKMCSFSTRLGTCVVGMNAIIDVSHCMCGSDQLFILRRIHIYLGAIDSRLSLFSILNDTNE